MIKIIAGRGKKTYQSLKFRLGVPILKEKFIICNHSLSACVNTLLPMLPNSAYTSHTESRLEF